MASKSKKGRNPGAVDNWLDSISLYRKNVAYDETCLFRAISEQLFDCQIYHERVRRECVEYGRVYYYEEFWHLLESEDEWYDHMDLLEKHMVVCGNIEIQIISQRYNRDVIVFDAAHQQIIDMTKRGLDKSLMLCLMNEDHYDVVYKRDHIQDAGFCQSIIYTILYENVFNIPNVQDIVHGMLYEKEFIAPPATEINNNVEIENKDEAKKSGAVVPSANVAPFPFKVAKALDPTIYRNIEYDSWTEVRRELRLGDWYYGDDNLILGTRCVLNENNATYECYIQEIIKNQNKCIVYVTKLAEKRTVNYTDLSPEDDAKPWPLPFRFSKNLMVSTPAQPQQNEHAPKTPKKRKDKRRIKSVSESSAQSHAVTFGDGTEHDINSYVGVPLQMQNNSENAQVHEVPQSLAETSVSQHNLLVTPDVPSPMPKFSWETPWNPFVPVMTESVMWPQVPPPPQNMKNFSMKPMVASAPVTPDVIPYHDNHYPYVYNYHVGNYNTYNNWPHHNEYVAQNHEMSTMVSEEINEREHHCIENAGRFQGYPETYEHVPNERPSLCTSVASSSPKVEIYSPMIQIPPGTPVIYAHTPEMTEMIMPTNVPVYPPPVDMQYIPSGPYIYPPTPPAAWYPPNINSQGFIFPSPVNQNMSK